MVNSQCSMGRTELATHYFPYIQPQTAWQKLRSLLAEDPALEHLARLKRRTFLPAEVNIIYQHLGQPWAALFRTFKAFGVSCLETLTFIPWNQDFPSMKLLVSYWSFWEGFYNPLFCKLFWRKVHEFTSSQVHKTHFQSHQNSLNNYILYYIYYNIYNIIYNLMWLFVPIYFTFCELVNLWTLLVAQNDTRGTVLGC